MNILDITPSDITRLQENKVVFGLLPERDREIFRFIGTGNTDRYCSPRFYRCREGGIFQESAVYRIVSDYALPAPTEADIIAYLQKSEVSPAQWHPAAQEWVRKRYMDYIWEYKVGDEWMGPVTVSSETLYIFRLRADYGRKEPEMEDYYAIPAKEPEVCVWVSAVQGHQKDPHGKGWCFSQEGIQTEKLHCPVCGKRISVKEEE